MNTKVTITLEQRSRFHELQKKVWFSIGLTDEEYEEFNKLDWLINREIAEQRKEHEAKRDVIRQSVIKKLGLTKEEYYFLLSEIKSI